MQQQSNHKKYLAVIGGGRWGQVIVSVLAEMKDLSLQVVIVSFNNFDKIKSTLDLNPTFGKVSFTVVSSITELLEKYDVLAAIIANSAKEHFKTAQTLINRGIHVLIEKPIVATLPQMNLLIFESMKHKAAIVPGLCYRFCSYLNEFSQQANAYGTPTEFELKWCDGAGEVRYNQVKTYDSSLNIIEDVMPHIWSILFAIFKGKEIVIKHCNENSTRDNVNLVVHVGNTSGQLILQRNASQRERYIALRFNDKKQIAMDFTVEPGIISTESKKISGDEFWEQQDGPLMKQLTHFIFVIEQGVSALDDIEACISSVKCTEVANKFLQNFLIAC